MIAAVNTLSLSTYVIGILIFLRLSFILAMIYIAYLLWVELHLLRSSCVNCYYYDGWCAFGRGKISAMLFPRRSAPRFIEHGMTWKQLIPDSFVLLFPFLGCIILLVQEFNFIILAAIFALIFLATAGNAFARGSLACQHCLQRELGCPAAQFFRVTDK